MITDADIKKMKKVFATKEDLKLFNKKFDQMDKKIDNLSKNVQKGQVELIELITNGFEAHEKRFTRIEDKVFNTN